MKRKASFFIDDILHSDSRDVVGQPHHVITDVSMTRDLPRDLPRDLVTSSYSRLAALKQRHADQGRNGTNNSGTKTSTVNDIKSPVPLNHDISILKSGECEHLRNGDVAGVRPGVTSSRFLNTPVTCIQTEPPIHNRVTCAQTFVTSERLTDSEMTYAHSLMTSERLFTNNQASNTNKLESVPCLVCPPSAIRHLDAKLAYKDAHLLHKPESVRVQPSSYFPHQVSLTTVNPQLRNSAYSPPLDAGYEHNVSLTPAAYMDELRQFPWVRHETNPLIGSSPYSYGDILSQESARISWLKEGIRQYPFPFYTGSPMTSSCDLLPQKTRRSRTVFTELQLLGLEKRFESQKYLSNPERASLAKTLGLSQIQVKTWYQNRRMKWKKQASYDSECENEIKPKGRPKKASEREMESESEASDVDVGHNASNVTTDDEDWTAHPGSSPPPQKAPPAANVASSVDASR